jgi:hemolysin activation/secretion protein
MRRYGLRTLVLAGAVVAVACADGFTWAKPDEPAVTADSAPGSAAGRQRAAGETPPVRQAGRDAPDAEVSRGEEGFPIREFVVEGNSILSEDRINEVLAKHKGERKTIKDIDTARRELEQAYHKLGYPAVIVVVPEQTVESGRIRLQVVEGRLGEIAVTGNRWYSRYNILGKLPSVGIGAMLYEPALVKDLEKVNANPDLKVTPLLKPGSEQGLVNMELKVKDRLPFHVKLQGDNQGPFTTPLNRLVLDTQYTNLWGMDHILNVQTMQTPEDWGAVQTYGVSYVAPVRWPDHLLSVYASRTASTSALAGTRLGIGGGDVSIAGNATVAGFRYAFPLYSGERSVHQLLAGADFKRLEKTEATFPGGLGTAVVLSPIQYTPLSVSYNASLVDTWGVTRWSVTGKGYAAVVPGGRKEDFAGDPNDPFNKPGVRAGASGNFAVAQASLDRSQDLPWGMNLFLHADGQWASEPLVVTEQYFVGGLDTVRGYVQFESLGDHAVRGRAELTSPELWPIPIDRIWQRRRSTEWDIRWKLAAFYDAASLWVRDAPAGQRDRFRLEGVGWGLRVRMPKDIGTVRIDQGFALQDATVTRRGDTFVHFLVNVVY